MEHTWYYAINGVRRGPVSFSELRMMAQSGALNPLDLVWHPDFGPEWRNARQVQGLFEAPRAPEPPVLDIQPEPERTPLVGVVGARPSAVEAAGQAFDRTVALLFRGFDPVRWLSMGFCAWMAYIGSQGSLNFDYLSGGTSGHDLKAELDKAIDGVLRASPGSAEIVGVIGGVALVALFAVLFCRLRSRGDFMFLHRWYRPDAAIRLCWTASREAGSELFKWRLYFFLIAFLLYALDAAMAYEHVLKPYIAANKEWSDALAAPAVACVTATVLLAFACELVAHLTKAFVVPVMYWHGVTATRAWLSVFSLCNQYPFAMAGYLLCGMACAAAAWIAILAVGLLTCCIGFIPMVLPYFGMVVLLPYYLFFRGYAVCFLSQWRSALVPASA
jgi:hypothetical protein